jgi:hypothetical protein
MTGDRATSWMTRRHFKALAEALASSRPRSTEPELLSQWKRDVRAITEVCFDSNNAFDGDKFRMACHFYDGR